MQNGAETQSRIFAGKRITILSPPKAHIPFTKDAYICLISHTKKVSVCAVFKALKYGLYSAIQRYKKANRFL